MKIKPLLGHTSQDTAYTVQDYPYGFRLRCKMRYWLESHPKKGFRLCMQSSNPKRNNETWNAIKKSTYSLICEGLYLDDNDHVHCASLSQYSSLADSTVFKQKFESCLNPDALESLNDWIKLKTIYEEKIRPQLNIQTTITPNEPILLSSLVK